MASDSKKVPEWKAFERLVARIEADAGPAGLIVKSPDRIPCKITGRLREVDASIRTRAGTSDLLVTIECRKRKNRQDVTWIEQLATKREHIGASKTIAVSSTGFSEEAYVVAQRVGIDLRSIEDVTLADLNPLLKLDFVLFHHKRCGIANVGLRFWRGLDWKFPKNGEVDLQLPPDTDPERLIFRNTETGDQWSLTDIWLQLQETVDPFEGVERDGKWTVRTACFPYPGNVDVETPEGTKRLGDVLFSVALSVTVEPVWSSNAKTVEYSSKNGSSLQRVEFMSEQAKEGEYSFAMQVPKDAADVRDIRTSFKAPGNPIRRSRP